MAGGILVYALHDDEGNFNKNSLGAISEAAKLAGELGSEAAAVAVGEVSDDACAGLGAYGAERVFRAKEAPEGLAQPIADVTMEVTEVKVADGKLVAERPVLQDSAIVDVGYVGEPGIIIGRLNAFDANEG